MSASNETDEMHLTPGGWVQGSEKLDFSGWKHRDPPEDRLLTVKFKEYLSSAFSQMERTSSETKHGTDAEIVAALTEHGSEAVPGAEHYRGWPEFLRSIGFTN